VGVWIVEFIAATGLALIAIPFRSAWVYGLLAAAILALGPFISIFVLSLDSFRSRSGCDIVERSYGQLEYHQPSC
jgi:hypothetical protein